MAAIVDVAGEAECWAQQAADRQAATLQRLQGGGIGDGNAGIERHRAGCP
ncbi:hypothetical protein ACFSQQ_23585 [Mesorhizobium kowhaii]